jgi:hypothetical protein
MCICNKIKMLYEQRKVQRKNYLMSLDESYDVLREILGCIYAHHRVTHMNTGISSGRSWTSDGAI